MLPTNIPEEVSTIPSDVIKPEEENIDIVEEQSTHVDFQNININSPSKKRKCSRYPVSVNLMVNVLITKDDEKLVDLIKKGHDVNIKHQNKVPLLIVALKLLKSDDVIKAIVAAGADLTATDDKGLTALMWALIKRRHSGVIRVLLDSLEISESLAYPSLMMMALQHSATDEVIKVLIEAGANLTKKDKNNRSPLWLALYRKRNDDVIMSLIQAGADVTSSINTGYLKDYTPLMMAMACDSRYGQPGLNCSFLRSPKIIEAMLTAGAIPSLQKYSSTLSPPGQLPHLLKVTGLSPIVAGLAWEYPEIVQMFVSRNFLTESDLSLPLAVKVALIKHLEIRLQKRQDTHYDTNNTPNTDSRREHITNTVERSEQCLSLAQSLLSQPWSLWTQSFVHISTRLGYGADRRDRIAKTELPTTLQRQLMFEASK